MVIDILSVVNRFQFTLSVCVPTNWCVHLGLLVRLTSSNLVSFFVPKILVRLEDLS